MGKTPGRPLAALLRDVATDRTGRYRFLGEMLHYNGLALLVAALLIVSLRAPFQLAWMLPLAAAFLAAGARLRRPPAAGVPREGAS